MVYFSYRYFDWVYKLQTVLLDWKQKFTEEQINYDEILTYANHLSQLKNLAQSICASSAIVDVNCVHSVKSMVLNLFEQLNALLIKYIPDQSDAQWCPLPSLLKGFGVTLPPHLLYLISQHVLFPGEEKAAEMLDNQPSPNTTGIFQPGHDISLKLTKALTLHKLYEIVQGLEEFLMPIMDILDKLVFFKLHPSEMFNTYVQVYLRKENKPCVKQGTTALSTFFTVPVFLATSMQPQPVDQNAVEDLSIYMLLSATNSANDLIMGLMQGTATYSEIVANGELNLEKLNIEGELRTLRSFLKYLKLPPAEYNGLAGVQNMLKLFQYIHHIRIIRSVCDQYQLQGCLKDLDLANLLHQVEKLDLEENRAKLTPLNASEMIEEVEKILFPESEASLHCLELFTAVRDSAVFYKFVREKRFVGKEGQAMFWQQYQLITAQLQHDEYDETVLNHLYAAFKLIQPFMDTNQNFQELMLQVISIDTTKGLKQLQTVNTNISTIQVWFSRAEVSEQYGYDPLQMCSMQ